jgi:uncharacterized protein YciW
MSEPDLMNRLAGLAPDSPLALLRAERADIARHTEGAYTAVITPADPAGLRLAERAAIARDVAAHNADATLTAHYESLLAETGHPDAGARWDAIAAHVAMVSATPRDASPAALDRLRAVGLGEGQIVALSQLVAYVSYQTRVLSGLKLMGAGDE